MKFRKIIVWITFILFIIFIPKSDIEAIQNNIYPDVSTLTGYHWTEPASSSYPNGYCCCYTPDQDGKLQAGYFCCHHYGYKTRLIQRTTLRFNPSSLPLGITINSAKLYLRVSDVYHNQDIYVYGSTNDEWTAGNCHGLVFQNCPSCGPSYDPGSLTHQDTVYVSSEGWKSWDATNFIKDEYNNSQIYSTLHLRSSTEGLTNCNGCWDTHCIRFYGPTSSQKPYLEIDYCYNDSYSCSSNNDCCSGNCNNSHCCSSGKYWTGSRCESSPTINYLRAYDYTHGQGQLTPGECMYRGDKVRFYMQFKDDYTHNKDMRYHAGGNPRIWARTDSGHGWNLFSGKVTNYLNTWNYWYYDWTIPSSAPFDNNGIEYYTYRDKDQKGLEVSGWQTSGGFNICCSPDSYSCSSNNDCCSTLTCVDNICRSCISKSCSADGAKDNSISEMGDAINDVYCTWNIHDGCLVKSDVETVGGCSGIPSYWEAESCGGDGGTSDLWGEKKVYINDINDYNIKVRCGVDNSSRVWINGNDAGVPFVCCNYGSWIDVTSKFITGWNTIKFKAVDGCGNDAWGGCGGRWFDLKWDIKLRAPALNGIAGSSSTVNLSWSDRGTGITYHLWSFNKDNWIYHGSDTNLIDKGGNNNNGIIHNGAIWTTGKIGKALSFDGTDDYVSVPNFNLPSNNKLSFEWWLKTDTLSGSHTIISDAAQSQTHGFFWIRQSNSYLYLNSCNGVGQWGFNTSWGNVFTDTNWHHFILVAEYDSDKATLYKDGALVETKDMPNAIPPETNGRTVYLGNYNPTHLMRWDGSIDEVRIYNRSLSATEIQEHYNHQFSDETGLALHLPFEEGTGTSTEDLSGRGLDSNTTYSYKVMATKNGYDSDWSNTISTTTWNQLPTADAGDNRFIVLGNSVNLDGSGSNDPDGDPISCRWDYSPSGLVSRWHFDENSGDIVYDTSGINNNDGVLKPASPIWTTGKVGNALQFNGVDDYVDCGNDSSLNITNAITIEAWVKRDSSGADNSKMIIRKENAFFLDVSRSWGDEPHFYVYVDGNWYLAADWGSAVGTDWTHLLATYNSSTKQSKMYVNGVLKHTRTLSGLSSYKIGTSGSNLIINQGGGFDGKIDEVRIYNRALSEDEIENLYEFGMGTLISNPFSLTPAFTPDTIGVYHIDLTVTDSYGGSHTDTVSITVASPTICGDNNIQCLNSSGLCEECDGTDDTLCPGECVAPGEIRECLCPQLMPEWKEVKPKTDQ